MLSWTDIWTVIRESRLSIIPPSPNQPLSILHIVRTPVGGIFRHILDLANGQIDRGHHVGILTDSLTGGERAEHALAEIAPRLKLGMYRFAMRREPSPGDLLVWARVMRLIRKLEPNVMHGHGAKAGGIVRLQRRSNDSIRVYTPHGGSLHYSPNTFKGAFYARIERTLKNNTDLFLFESAFARDTYQRTVGVPKGLVRCVFNGVTPEEFEPVVTADDATDLAYVGEFRYIKGADLLIDAVARLHANGKKVTLTLGGDGEEMATLKAQIERLGLASAVRFIGHVPARYGFSKGRLLIVPSRGDSMPYVAIEAGAAGIPMIAAGVGGIPEILGAENAALFAPGNIKAMAEAISSALDNPQAVSQRTSALRERISAHFSQQAMVEGILAGYRDALANH